LTSLTGIVLWSLKCGFIWCTQDCVWVMISK
jgi:hypothetical protein